LQRALVDRPVGGYDQFRCQSRWPDAARIEDEGDALVVAGEAARPEISVQISPQSGPRHLQHVAQSAQVALDLLEGHDVEP
jgi:hypothetical protein